MQCATQKYLLRIVLSWRQVLSELGSSTLNPMKAPVHVRAISIERRIFSDVVSINFSSWAPIPDSWQ
jgi:hypothetical protein